MNARIYVSYCVSTVTQTNIYMFGVVLTHACTRAHLPKFTHSVVHESTPSCIYTHMQAYTLICTHSHTLIHSHQHAPSHAHMIVRHCSLYVYAYAYKHSCLHACAYLCMCLCTRLIVHTETHIYGDI